MQNNHYRTMTVRERVGDPFDDRFRFQFNLRTDRDAAMRVKRQVETFLRSVLPEQATPEVLVLVPDKDRT